MLKEASNQPQPSSAMEIEDGSINSSTSYTSTIAVLKEQIDYLQDWVWEKQIEIDQKNSVIDQLHADKRMYQEKYESADFNSIEMKHKINTLVWELEKRQQTPRKQ